MSPFWQIVIRPLLLAIDARLIIEIGAAAGRMTTKLLEFATEQSAVVHAIDPAPAFDADELARASDGCLFFHPARSHDALERIAPADAVLIDGDHNWYTVHGELIRLERIADLHGRPFPLVMLHDVEWPYARRDLYYDPDSIPGEWRQPWAREGIVWGQSRLDSQRGINPRLANGCEEGTPRNGVLTAVEDFIEESKLSLAFRTLPGYSGLGILVPADKLQAGSRFRQAWDGLASAEFLEEHARRLAERASQYEALAMEQRSASPSA